MAQVDVGVPHEETESSGIYLCQYKTVTGIQDHEGERISSVNHVLRVGKYDLCDLANMDQTPLPFISDDGTTYEHQGSKDVCCKSSAPGLEKRQATAQITVFADGIPRIKPLIIFKGLRISAEEKKVWESRVTLFFQENPWCDEQTMVKWIQSEWNHFFLNPSTPGSDGKILVVDIPTD